MHKKERNLVWLRISFEVQKQILWKEIDERKMTVCQKILRSLLGFLLWESSFLMVKTCAHGFSTSRRFWTLCNLHIFNHFISSSFLFFYCISWILLWSQIELINKNLWEKWMVIFIHIIWFWVNSYWYNYNLIVIISS